VVTGGCQLDEKEEKRRKRGSECIDVSKAGLDLLRLVIM